MANLVLGKPSKKQQKQPEIIEISSDENDSDSDMGQTAPPLYTRNQALPTDLTRGPRHAKLPAPILRFGNIHQPSKMHSRPSKRQKIAHNDDLSSTIARNTQQFPVIPPLPELRDIGLDFDDPHLLGASSDNMATTFEPYTRFPAFEEWLQPTKPEPQLKDAKAIVSVKARDRLPVKKEAICPYYQDPILNALMYRGPGYEDFPVVFGTNEDHQQARDKWDKEEAARATKQRYHSPSNAHFVVNTQQGTFDQSSDEEAKIRKPPTRIEAFCLSRVREILPDIQQDFVIQMFRSRRLQILPHEFEDADDDSNTHVSVDNVVMSILEQESYPKEEKKLDEGSDRRDLGKTVPLVKGDPENDSYRLDSVGLLAAHFTRVPTYEINKIFQEKRSLYDAYLHIEHTEEKYYSMHKKPYKRLHKPRSHLERKYESFTPKSHTNIAWRNVVNELQAAKQQIARENLRLVREKEDGEHEARNLESHKKSGNIVECKCCFDEEVALNRVVACDGDDLHWFCFSCVKNLAASQLGLMRYEMLCMDGSGCKASLSQQSLTQAVPTKILDKLDLLQQQAEISAAGIKLDQCPHCGFQANCDDRVFRCQDRTCGRFTCRECQQDAHEPKTCKEARKDKGLSARHMVEEARSEAMMRECPKCKVKIIKESGCNKIVCTKCACISCFVCKQDISDKASGGYQHFNAPGAVCTLYDKNFDRHDADANKAEQVAIAKLRAENLSLDEEELRIETGIKKAKRDSLKDRLEDRVQVNPGLPPHQYIAGAMQGVYPDGNPAGDVLFGDLPRQRLAGHANQPDEFPFFGIDAPEAFPPRQAQQIPRAPIDHTAHITTAQRIHASMTEHHARLRRAVDHAGETIGVDQRPRGVLPATLTKVAPILPGPAEMWDDDQMMALGPNEAINLDGHFDHEPIHYQPYAATNPHLNWHHVYDDHLAQPNLENLFDGTQVEHNRQVLFHDDENAPFSGADWNQQKNLHRVDGDDSEYEDALERL